MAQLTDQIGGVTNRIRVQDPGPRGPSFLQGLADTASTAIAGIDNIRRNRQEARARREAQRAETALDELAAAAFDETASDFMSMNGNGPNVIEVPGPIRAEIERVNDIREGEAQGRLPSGRSLNAVESFIARARREYPDQMFEIMQAVRQEGWDHYLFREVALQREQEDFERETQQNLQRSFEEIATNNIPVEQLASTPEGRARQGQAFSVAQNELERSRAAATEARAAAGERRAAASFARAEASRAGYRAAVNFLQASVYEPMEELNRQILSGALPPGQARLDRLEEIRGMLVAARGQVMGMIAEYGDASMASNIESQLDSMEQTLESIVTSDNAQEILSTMESQLGLRLAESLPGFAVSRAMLGENAAGAMYAPAVYAHLQENGFLDDLPVVFGEGSVGPSSGMMRIRNHREAIRTGNFDAEDVEAVGPLIRQEFQQSRGGVLTGNEVVAENFADDYRTMSQLISYDVFQRGMVVPGAAVAGANELFGGESREALRDSGDPRLINEAMIWASNALEAVQSPLEGTRFRQGARATQNLRFNTETGYFESTLTSQESRLAQLGNIAAGTARPAVDQSSYDAAAAANIILDFMEEFGNRSGTPLQQRAYYAGIELPENND